MRHLHVRAANVFLSGFLFAWSAAAQGYPPPTTPAQPAPPVYAPAPYPPPPGPAPAYPPTSEPPPGWSPPGYAGQYRYAPPPMELRYIEGRPIPAGYHLETRPRKGLIVSGAIIFGVPYFLSLSVAASSRSEPDRWLYAPLVGPFVDLGNRKDNCSTVDNQFGVVTSCAGDSSERFFLMADGLMQVAGATMLILGLALPQTLLVRDDAPFVGSKRSPFTWALGPRTMSRSGYGVELAGTF